MSIKSSASNLSQAAKDLMIDWQQTKSSWRDVKSQEFERTYLDNIPYHLARASAVMEEIDVLLRKVRNDCE